MTCEVRINCVNHPNECWSCRFAGSGIDNNYLAIDKSIKHPQLLAEKAERKKAIKEANDAKKKNKDRDKTKLLKKASNSEKKVRDTLNSGRINRDADLQSENFAIDVKLQSTRKNPEIKLEEWRKLQNDALRANKPYSVLIIENSEGQRFVIMDEETFGAFLDEQ
jgi:hypothetical protein